MLWARPVLLSTPICSCMPKCHCLPAGLTHLGIARAFGVLGRTRRGDDGGVHDGAVTDRQSVRLQPFAHLGEQRRPQVVILAQPAELQQRRRVGRSLNAQVNAHELVRRGAVE